MYTLQGQRVGASAAMVIYSQGIAPCFMELNRLRAFHIYKMNVRLSGIETLDITRSLYRFQRLWRRWWRWRQAVRAIATPRRLLARELDGRNLKRELERMLGGR